MNSHPLLSQKFPGELRRVDQQRGEEDQYEYFLPGDIFQAKNMALGYEIQAQIEQAALKLGYFATTIENIPNIDHFITSFLNKEATHSTRIEGTQATIDEAFQNDEKEISSENREDWRELRQYIQGLRQAARKIETIPISSRLIKNIHHILLSQARGKDKLPGEYRVSQNWIGGSMPGNAHFVPPAPEHVPEAMGNLEKFINSKDLRMSHLVKAALIHYQFETIHPFLDGNGRIGRILIPIYLMEAGVISKPILYISDFFERNRQDYYQKLDGGRKSEQGLVEWISFFMRGVRETSEKGIETAGRIIALQNEVNESVLELGRRAKQAQEIANELFQYPFIDAGRMRKKFGLSPQASYNMINDFVRLGILQDITDRKRNRIYVFDRYIDILRS